MDREMKEISNGMEIIFKNDKILYHV